MAQEISNDQHFLIDQTIINNLVSSANITKDDIVLEIGAGSGNITLPLSKQTTHLFASELDPQFFSTLQNIKNLTLIPGDVLKTLPKQKNITLVIGNIPYQLTEPIMHLLCQSKTIHKASFILPKTFAQRLQQHPIFSAFWHTTIIQDVPSSAFQPKPRGTSVIAQLTKRSDTNPSLFFIRKLYLQSDKKLKNGLREGLIDFWNARNETLTKKQADAMIEPLSLLSLDKPISSLKPSEYVEIIHKIRSVLKNE
jgi:16S rRNA (adenine1518-N6/adenine1519-N6)-dimethyltransferase